MNQTTPVIQQIEDLKNHSVNVGFTSGNILAIRDSNLKYDESDPQQDVFFIDESGNATRAENTTKNKPSELLVFAHEGLSGTFHVEVRAILKGRKNLQVFRFQQEPDTVQ